jgi:putative modified peptide
MTTDNTPDRAGAPLDGSILERIMDRMATDDDFRTLLATKPYKALGDLGIAADEARAIRDATLASDTLALSDRA